MPVDSPRRTLDAPTVAVVTAVAFAIAAAVFFLLGGTGGADDDRVDAIDSGSLELFSPDHPYSPEFLLPDGDRGSLAAFKGEPLVVNFFGSWCAPCIAELPDLQEAADESGVRFVGLAVRDRPDDAAEIIEQTGVEYFWAIDDSLDIYTAVRGVSMPTTVFFDAQGEMVAFHGGLITKDRVLELIDEHFAA